MIGRSNIVGKPMAQLLLGESCTVTIAHSRTRDLPDVVRRADIVVAAVGRPEMVNGDWLKPGATVIDVGINRIAGEGGNSIWSATSISPRRSEVAGAITPVPGGVGPMTIACLIRNTLVSAARRDGFADSGGFMILALMLARRCDRRAADRDRRRTGLHRRRADHRPMDCIPQICRPTMRSFSMPQPVNAHDFAQGRARNPRSPSSGGRATAMSAATAPCGQHRPLGSRQGASRSAFSPPSGAQKDGEWRWIYDGGDDLDASSRAEGGDIKPTPASCTARPTKAAVPEPIAGIGRAS